MALTVGALAVLSQGPAALAAPDRPTAPARALILTGANNHNWKETTPELKSDLEDDAYFSVDVCDDPEATVLSDAKALAGYQVVVLNINRDQRWQPDRETNLLNYVRNGGGLVVFHAADNAFPGWEEFDRLVGGTWGSRGTSFPDRGTFHPAYGPFEVNVVDQEHPITAGIGSSFTTRDEMYTNLRLQSTIHVLAQGVYRGKPQPMLFISRYGQGRMFQTALGHDLNAMRNPRFKDTLIRGTRWAAGTLRSQ
jgi:type 1 glutamine amidotransferase